MEEYSHNLISLVIALHFRLLVDVEKQMKLYLSLSECPLLYLHLQPYYSFQDIAICAHSEYSGCHE